MTSRFEHLLKNEISTELAIKRPPAPMVVINDNCPIYAYINSLKAKSSQVTAKNTLQAIANHLGQDNYYCINWAAFDRNTLNSLVNELTNKNLAPDTIGLYLSVAKSVLKEAFLLGQIDTLHWERVKTVKRPSSTKLRQHQILSQNDFNALMSDIESMAKTPNKLIRDKAIFHTLVGCGLRRFELVGLTMSDLDVENKTLQFYGKGRKERKVQLHPLTFDELQKWLDIRTMKSGPIFTRINKNGSVSQACQPLSTDAIYMLCQDYGLIEKGVAPHSLRRSYATWLNNNGADILHISKLLGHASTKTTEVYLRTEQKELSNTVLTKLF